MWLCETYHKFVISILLSSWHRLCFCILWATMWATVISILVPLSQKWYTDICGQPCEKQPWVSRWMVVLTAPREYHEKSGRLVKIDKFHTVESKKEKARVASSEWRLRNPRARWTARRRLFYANEPADDVLLFNKMKLSIVYSTVPLSYFASHCMLSWWCCLLLSLCSAKG